MPIQPSTLRGLSMHPGQKRLDGRSLRMLGWIDREVRFDLDGLVGAQDRTQLPLGDVLAGHDRALERDAEPLRGSIQRHLRAVEAQAEAIRCSLVRELS